MKLPNYPLSIPNHATDRLHERFGVHRNACGWMARQMIVEGEVIRQDGDGTYIVEGEFDGEKVWFPVKLVGDLPPPNPRPALLVKTVMDAQQTKARPRLSLKGGI